MERVQKTKAVQHKQGVTLKKCRMKKVQRASKKERKITKKKKRKKKSVTGKNNAT